MLLLNHQHITYELQMHYISYITYALHIYDIYYKQDKCWITKFEEACTCITNSLTKLKLLSSL